MKMSFKKPIERTLTGTRRVIAFGDNLGLPQLHRYLPPGTLVGIVAASIRPQYLTTLRSLADSLAVPLFIQPKYLSPSYRRFVRDIADLEPDFLLVNSYAMKLYPEVLSIPRWGSVNIHGALLPRYRGCNPIQWAILNNETETGVTMHYMDDNFDTGDIISQRRVPIYFEDTWRQVQDRLLMATEMLLAEELPLLLAGLSSRRPQDGGQACSFRRRNPEDGAIDWQSSLVQIHNLVRALVKPLPGAFYYSGTQKITLEEYQPIPNLARLKYGKEGGHTLRSNQIALRPLGSSDLMLIQKHKDLLRHLPQSLGTHAELDFDDLLQRNDIILFAIELCEIDQLVGLGQLFTIDYQNHTAKLQIGLIGSRQVTHIYEREAIKLLGKFAFGELYLNSISLCVPPERSASLAVYERLGFRLEKPWPIGLLPLVS